MQVCPCGHLKYGYRIHNQVLEKHADGQAHMLHEPRGWAVQASVFDYHKDEIAAVAIEDARSGICYQITTEAFNRVKIPLDRGLGEQYAIPLKYFHLSCANTKQLALL